MYWKLHTPKGLMKMSVTTIQRTKTITKVTRGKFSREGNPSFAFHTDDVADWAKTRTNTSIAYKVTGDFPIDEDIERVVLFTIELQIRELKTGRRSYRNVIDYEVIEVRK